MPIRKSSPIMRGQTVLLPVCESLYPWRMHHHLLWLDRCRPAKIHIVVVLLPTGLLRWLLSPFHSEDRAWRLQEVKRLILEEHQVVCETETLTAPNVTIGIVEAAWRFKPDSVVLTSALQQNLGKSGLRDLQIRLGELGHCVLLLVRDRPVVRVEPCNCLQTSGQVIHAKFGQTGKL